MASVGEIFREFPFKYLDRPWSNDDGLNAEAISAAVASSGIVIPGSLRAFYEALGSCAELLTMDAEIYPVDELEVDDGFLVFADENQSVVSWGFRVEDLDRADPTVWQRNNDEDAWYDEEKPLLSFLQELFDFTTGTSSPTDNAAD